VLSREPWHLYVYLSVNAVIPLCTKIKIIQILVLRIQSNDGRLEVGGPYPCQTDSSCCQGSNGGQLVVSGITSLYLGCYCLCSQLHSGLQRLYSVATFVCILLGLLAVYVFACMHAIIITTLWVKKQDTKLLPIISPNINRFSHLFYCRTR